MTATAQQLEYLKNSIKSIQDYPKPGILFRDVTSLLEDPKAYALSIDLLVERYKNAGITKVASKSSTTRTLSPGLMAPTWISSRSVPYSRS